MRQLSPTDALMLYLETPNTPNHVASLLIYDPSTAPEGKVTFKGILAEVERRLHLAGSFRQKLVEVPMRLDDPYWVEDATFDLEFHVRHIALPKPGDWRQFCIQAARVHARPLDLSRPPWEMYVVEGLDHVQGVPEGAFAIILKVHHAAVDGVAGVEMLNVIHDKSPLGEPPPPETEWKPDRDPSAWALLGRTGLNYAAKPMHLARIASRTLPALRPRLPLRKPPVDLVTPGMKVPRTRFNRQVSPHRVVEGRRFPLPEIKHMKTSVPGATVNDVALTIVGGALRKYLAAHGELPDESLVSLVPISTRSPDQTGVGGNYVSMTRVSLYTDVDDARERLTAMRQATRVLKERADTLGARTLTDISELLPGALFGAAVRGTAQLARLTGTTMGANTTVTNVPGPREPLYFCGARVVALFGMAPVVNGGALIHPVGSYCDEFLFSITADRDAMPDPAFYASCLEDSYWELAKATE
ncbi:MAG TPA: wax ester/triacylglycerol synthase family O-acyltransferase [Acidimicrobiales bacterium]|nr:wax ester/triacylglycerol synthase family O-acyltransferase [Acidimicrobiales bacterium]